MKATPAILQVAAAAPRGVPSHPRPVTISARDVRKRLADSCRRHLASPPAPPCPAGSGVGRREISAVI
jgi:hypothetical protein